METAEKLQGSLMSSKGFVVIKRCNHCKQILIVTAYSKNKRMSDGLQNLCKSCAKDYHQKWNVSNRELVAEKYKKFIEKNPGYWKEYYAQNRNNIIEWRKDNQERAREIAKNNYHRHKEEYSKKSREYYRKNTEHIKETTKKWYADHNEEMKEYYAIYRARNPERVAAQEAVRRAIKKGELPHASEVGCLICGSKQAEYHHESYAPEDRLNVISLCRKDHKRIHSEIQRESILQQLREQGVEV